MYSKVIKIYVYIKLGNTDGHKRHKRAGSEGRIQWVQTVKFNQKEEETKMSALRVKSTQEQQKAC